MTRSTAASALADGCVKECPGCAHRGWRPTQSFEQKYRFLRERLSPWANRLQPVRTVTEQGRWSYRDRVQLGCQWCSETHSWQVGLRRRDTLIPIPRCPIQSLRVNRIIELLLPVLPADGGAFRLSYWVQSGAQLVLVLKQSHLPDTNWLAPALQTLLSETGLEGLWLHLHPSAGKKVLAKRGWHLIWGQPRSKSEAGLWYGPAAFQQLLPSLFDEALDDAKAFLSPTKTDRVLDLYSGNGSSLHRWSSSSDDVVGVESGGEAINCARLNVPDATLLRGHCQQRLPQLELWRRDNPDAPFLVYTNPPRTGMEPAVTEWIGKQLQPLRLAYLSCSPATLYRDLTELEAAGLHVRQLIPFDFFPQTRHVETLALMSRTDP